MVLNLCKIILRASLEWSRIIAELQTLDSIWTPNYLFQKCTSFIVSHDVYRSVLCKNNNLSFLCLDKINAVCNRFNEAKPVNEEEKKKIGGIYNNHIQRKDEAQKAKKGISKDQMPILVL